MSKTQDFKHHGRVQLPFVLTVVVLVANLVFAIIHVVHHVSVWNAWLVFLSAWVFIPVFLLRVNPLRVQDRVIRLEERLRLQALAPADLRPHIYRLSEDQLVGLRFASDDEVISLARQALEEKLNRRQIKERIRNWRPDYWRV